MMFPSRFLLSIVFASFSILLFAQSNYHSGYIITNTGDTIRGQIDFKEWRYNPDSFKFKKQGENEVTRIDVKHCKGFEVDGAYKYKVASVKMSKNKVDYPSLSTNPDTTFVEEDVFLRELILGKHISLYGYTDAIKNRYYYAVSGEAPQELLNRPYLGWVGESSVVKNDKLYLRQLYKEAVRFGVDIEIFNKKVRDLNYTLGDISKVIGMINGEEPHSSKKLKGKAMSYYAGIGADFSKLIFKESLAEGKYFYQSESGMVISPLINLGIDYPFNRFVHKSGLKIELSGRTLSAENYNDRMEGGIRKVNTLTIKRRTFALSPSVYYNILNKPQLSIPVSVGIRVNFHQYLKSEKIENIYYTEEYNQGGNVLAYGVYPILFDVPLSVGIRIKKIEMLLAFNFQTSSLDNNSFLRSLTMVNGSCIFNYHF